MAAAALRGRIARGGRARRWQRAEKKASCIKACNRTGVSSAHTVSMKKLQAAISNDQRRHRATMRDRFLRLLPARPLLLRQLWPAYGARRGRAASSLIDGTCLGRPWPSPVRVCACVCVFISGVLLLVTAQSVRLLGTSRSSGLTSREADFLFRSSAPHSTRAASGAAPETQASMVGCAAWIWKPRQSPRASCRRRPRPPS